MKVSLVLGSGGARGYAHIGVIEEIKRRGHEIVAISGTSMGSLIGGLEAAGKLDDFADWATSLTHLDVFRLYDPAFSQPGVIKADKIFQMVNSFVDNVQIEDLEIPFTAVATDIVNHREVWFQRGDLVTAMRASCALPTFIAPIMVNGKILADGGLVNPVPVEPTSAIPSGMSPSRFLSADAQTRFFLPLPLTTSTARSTKKTMGSSSLLGFVAGLLALWTRTSSGGTIRNPKGPTRQAPSPQKARGYSARRCSGTKRRHSWLRQKVPHK